METLKYIQQQVTDWLKFAEAKSLALIVFNSSLMLALLGAVSTVLVWTLLPFKLAILFLFLGNFISLCFILWAVIPRINKHLTFHKRWSNEHNLYFYVDLANYDINDLLTSLKDKYGCEDVKVESLGHQAMAKQIVINSIITCLKLKWFTIAWWTTAVTIAISAVTSIVGVIIYFSS